MRFDKGNVVVLFDLPCPPPENHDYSAFKKDEDWESELAVFNALRRLGFTPKFVGVYNDIEGMIRDIQAHEPKFIFNMAQSFLNDRRFEPQIAGLLELLKIPYTGTKSLGLSLCQDKGLCKKILAHHRIRVPRWISSHVHQPLKKLADLEFPAFVKPANEEGSEGITQDSFVENEKDCLERTKFLHEKYKCDVIIEEFIAGRELYVSVMGAKRLKVLPVREMTFGQMPEDGPRFATFKAKWDKNYRDRWKIKNDFAKAIPDDQMEQIERMVKKAFEVLNLKTYARFDLRLKDSGEVVMLEANPNPALGPEDDFPRSADRAGLNYTEMVGKIVESIAIN